MSAFPSHRSWVFLTPPIEPFEGRPLPNPDEPLSRWNYSRAFDTAKDCEYYRDALSSSAVEQLKRGAGKSGEVEDVLRAVALAEVASRCEPR